MARTARLDDIVVAVLHFLRQKQDTFPADRERLHRVFCSLSNSFPQLLGTMEFRTKGMFPESLLLDQVFANLEAARLLHRKNAEPSFYQVEDGIDKSYERFVEPRLNAAGVRVTDLKKLAAGFREQALTVV